MADQQPIFAQSWFGLYQGLQQQVLVLQADVRGLKAEREKAQATNDALVRAGAAAQSAKAEAERKLAISQKLFESLRQHHLACNGNGNGNMSAEAEHDRAVDLEKENADLKAAVKQLKDDKHRLEGDLAHKVKEIINQGNDASKFQRANDELTQKLKDTKTQLQQEISDAADIRTNLDSAYADLSRKEDEHRALRKQKDDTAAELYAAQLQLKDAHDYFQQSEKRVEEIESQKAAIQALEQDNATLQADVDNMQTLLEEQDRTVLVKDARIAYLENQCQKALAAAARAQDKANAAADPTTAEPTSIALAPDESLQDELDHLSEASDELFHVDDDAEAELEPSLELRADYPTVETAPFQAPPPTHSSTQTAVSFTQNVTSSTQTEVPSAQATTSSTQTEVSSAQVTTSSTQTESHTAAETLPVEPQQPTLTLAPLSTVEIAPIEPSTTLSASDVRLLWERQIEPALQTLSTSSTGTIHFILERVQDLTHATRTTSSSQTEEELRVSDTITTASIAPVEFRQVQTEPPKLTHTGSSTVLDEPPVANIERHTQTDIEPLPSVVTVHKKNSFFSISTALAIFFAILSLLYWAELETQRTTDNRIGINRLYNSMGYQRRGRHLFGTIPVCYEHGETWLTEALCQQFAAGVQKAEAWAGISYPSTW